MKKILALVMACAMCASLMVGCGSSGTSNSGSASGSGSTASTTDTPVTLVCGNVASGDTNPYNMCMNWAADYLKQNNSTVTLDLQLQGVLGSETEQCQQVVLGNQDIAQTADMSTTNIFPKMAFANFPMLFKDYDAVHTGWAQDGWAFKIASGIMNDGGVVLLGAGDNGFRIITNSKHEVKTFDDMKGLKVRVPEDGLLLEIWDKFGCQTAPIAFSELTTALQQGTVDGQELGLQHFYSNRWDEFNKYMTQTNYDYSAFLIFINKAKYDSLSAKQQKDLMDAFSYACDKEIDYAVDFNNKGLDEMVKDGLDVTPMTDEFRDQIYKVGYDIAHEAKWTDVLGQDLVNQIYPSETRQK